MAIFPRYNIPEQEIPTVAMPVAPADTSLIEGAKMLAQAGSSLSGAFHVISEKKRKLRETTLMAQKVMQAELEMDSLFDSLKGGAREDHAKAPEKFVEGVQKAEYKWKQGLNPDQQALLQRTLLPKFLMHQRNTRGLQNAFLVDDAKASLLEAENHIKENAYRLDQPDDQVFAGLYTTYQDIESGTGAKQRVGGSYVRYLASLVDANLLSREDATKRLKETTQAAAYGRLQRMTVSDNPALVQRAIDVLKQEETQKGSTFAIDIEVKDRNQLLKESQGHLVTLETRAREEADRVRKQYEADVKKTEEAEVTTLTSDILQGKDVTVADLDRARGHNGILARERAVYEHLYDLIQKRADGPTKSDAVVYRELWDRAMRGRLTAMDVIPYAGTKITRKDAEHLVTVSTSRTITDDDFYKTGYRDLENALRPPAGILDEAKQRRFSEAAREYFDRGKVLIEGNQREKLPELSREISDRWLMNAKSIEVKSPRYMPRYADKETTLQAWQAQYGQNPQTWPPAARREFDRQVWMREQLAPAQTSTSDTVRSQQGQGASSPKTQQKSKLPSPF